MENAAHLMMELPKDYEEDCYKEGAIKRRRGVASPADLMMLAIFHMQNGCSLLEISEIARITKLGKMSDVAFMKRFEKCGSWFQRINEKLTTESIINYQKPEWLKDKTVIAVDASDVREKGRSGRIYRLHYALDIFKMARTEHKITTNKTGESICNFALKHGQLVIADRAYSSIKGIEHCRSCGVEYVFRLRKTSFTVCNEEGGKVDLLAAFVGPGEGDYADLTAAATNMEGKAVPVRICATRKTADAIEQSKKKIKRFESKRQRKLEADTKTFHEYIVVVTNINTDISAKEILELYRLRWQVEIYFKRLKSILDFGELPKKRPESVVAWLNGKMMIALLIEIMISKASFPLKNIIDRSIWRETKFINLFMSTNFYDVPTLLTELTTSFQNLRAEKRVMSKKLQMLGLC